MAKTHWTAESNPSKAQRGLFGAIVVWTIALSVLFAVIGVVAWQVGWIFKAENVERQVRIDNQNTGVQTAWHDQAAQGVKDFYVLDPSNTAARGALRNQTCDLIARLADPYLSDDLAQFQAKECK